MLLTLAMINPGQFVLISELLADGEGRRRLMDLGFTPGTRVEVIRRSPLGDPTAYGVRGTVIALRSEEARQVHCYSPRSM